MYLLIKNTKLSTFCLFTNFPQFSKNLSFISSQFFFKRNISSIIEQNTEKQSNKLINYAILNKLSIEDLQQEGFPFWQMKCAVENAINENLENSRFFHAQNVWKMFLENTQSTFGILSLIEFAIKNYEGDKLRRNIAFLWHESKTLLSAGDFIAYLVIAMMRTGYIEEANVFAKKFTIFGTSFIIPFKEAIEKEKNCLEFFNQFSQLLENVFFSVPTLTKELKAKRKAKMKERNYKNNEKLEDKKMEEDEEINEEQIFKIIQEEKKPLFIFQNLIWIWAPPRKTNCQTDVLPRNKPKKQRIYKVDLKSLEKFCIEFVELWQQKAVQNSDFSALENCHSFIKRNGLSNLSSSTGSTTLKKRDLNNNKSIMFN
ncbi:hypothetical protein ACQ4LE_002789 [Meloidogyne hapla]